MSQDVFQSKIDQTFEGCSDTIGISDDIVIFGKTEQEHDENMHGVMERCRDTGLKLNPDKTRVKKKYNSTEERAGITDIPWSVTYMAPFIPNLSTETAPLRELVKKGNKFSWTASHTEVFEKLKNSITTEVTLAYFDPTQKLKLQVDASSKGLGAALLQNDKPIAFASKALTDTETRYANIEREMLAVVYGCERFHTYLYGQPFIVESDHKPLESIHLKHLTSAPPRLQRLLIRLQSYDLVIKYRLGKEMVLADALSRLSPEEKQQIDTDVHIHEVCSQFSTDMLERLKEETKADPELSALKEMMYTGWPETRTDLPLVMKPYWTFRDELAVEDGLLMKGSRIIIPKIMQNDILNKLHAAHQGTEKTKLRARTAVFWRNLNKDIDQFDELTKSCQSCQEHKCTQTKEPLMPTEVPPRAKGDKYRSEHCTTVLEKYTSGQLPSPAELLLGRKVQDNLPQKINSPKGSDEVRERLQEKQISQKIYHDQHTKLLPGLVAGQKVTIQDAQDKRWRPAMIQKHESPRSYVVETPAGKQLRRNRSHIRDVPNHTPQPVRFNMRQNQHHTYDEPRFTQRNRREGDETTQ
ncbi:hypothetical protein ScPMuIL_003721 [Solemya velum]